MQKKKNANLTILPKGEVMQIKVLSKFAKILQHKIPLNCGDGSKSGKWGVSENLREHFNYRIKDVLGCKALKII